MSLEILAEALVEAGYIQQDFAALVLMRRKGVPLGDRRTASLALADWYEERGRYVEAAQERKRAEMMAQ